MHLKTTVSCLFMCSTDNYKQLLFSKCFDGVVNDYVATVQSHLAIFLFIILYYKIGKVSRITLTPYIDLHTILFAFARNINFKLQAFFPEREIFINCVMLGWSVINFEIFSECVKKKTDL